MRIRPWRRCLSKGNLCVDLFKVCREGQTLKEQDGDIVTLPSTTELGRALCIGSVAFVFPKSNQVWVAEQVRECQYPAAAAEATAP